MPVNTPASPGVEAPSAIRREPVNILLVDDELNNLKALEAVLAAGDRRLMWAQSGEDALRWLLKERFAVVLLDVFMPGMDGFETAQLIRQHVRSQSTPIIFLTAANKDSAHISRGYALGAVDYILKPFDVSILRSKVDVFVELFRKTEQVRCQAELLTEARGFLQNVLESTTDYAIIASDLDGTVMGWYEGARLLYGYTAEDVVGKLSVRSIFAPEEVEGGRMQETFEAALRDGRGDGVFEHLRQDGQRFTASVSLNLWRDAGEEVVGHVLVVKDITEQQLQEERARLLIKEQAARAEAETAKRRFALLAEASSELGRLLDDSSALQSVARLTASNFAGVCMIDLVTENGEIRRIAMAHRDPEQERPLQDLPKPDAETPFISSVLRGEPVFLPQISGQTLDEIAADPSQVQIIHSFKFTSAMIVAIPGRDSVLGAIWLFSDHPDGYGTADLDFALDLSRRIGLALDNARLYREAQEAISAREEFLSVASHELKTPVTSLRGHAQLMIRQLEAKGAPDPDRLQRAFRVIDVQSERLTHLLSQLLDVSRLQAGKLELERSRADLRSLVEEVVARVRQTTTDHSIELHAPDETIGEIDPLRIEQVVTNLLDNAVKYSPNGGRIEVELSQSSNGTLHLAVRDWGMGIPEEHRPHIFDRFHQAPGKHRTSGMGLGLYISRQISELHGGEIQAEFLPDGGTRFVVTLPSGIDPVLEHSD